MQLVYLTCHVYWAHTVLDSTGSVPALLHYCNAPSASAVNVHTLCIYSLHSRALLGPMCCVNNLYATSVCLLPSHICNMLAGNPACKCAVVPSFQVAQQSLTENTVVTVLWPHKSEVEKDLSVRRLLSQKLSGIRLTRCWTTWGGKEGFGRGAKDTCCTGFHDGHKACRVLSA